jgi:(R,R)-butanediol dehydrogenase/meso-butanediol dehydrogenase/diacetyl reductase
VLLGMIGLDALAAPHGGFAPRIAIDAARLYTMRDGLSFEQGAMLEPATVAVHAVRRTGLRLGDGVAVLGAGPIGLLVLQVARAAGAGRLVVIEPGPHRRGLAAKLGAATLDPGEGALPERIRAELGADPDVVFECAGVAETVDQSAELARRGGTVTLVGLANDRAEIGPATWLAKEIRLVAALGYLHAEFAVAMQLVLDGRLRLEPLHTATLPLAELESGFQRLRRPGEDVKILIDPQR